MAEDWRDYMSLLDDFARTCVLMEKKRVPDGAGGVHGAMGRGGGVHKLPGAGHLHGGQDRRKRGRDPASIPLW